MSSAYNISGYSPIEIVQHLHDIPHLNRHFQTVSSTFNFTSSTTWNDYAQSVIVLPGTLIGIYTLLVLILFVIVIVTACFHCFDTRLSITESNNNLIPAKSGPSVKGIYIAFNLFCGAVIIMDQFAFFGNNFTISAIGSFLSTVDDVHSTMSDLNDYGMAMTVIDTNIANLVTSAIPTCPSAAYINTYLPELVSNVNDYNSYISPLPDKIQNAHDDINSFGTTYKNDAIWAMYALIMLLCFMYYASIYLKSKAFLVISILANNLFMWIMFILGCVLMVIVTVLADFCMSPFNNLLMLVPDDIYDITSFYVTCQGTDPLADPISQAEYAVSQLTTYINTLLSGPCHNNQYLLSMQQNATLMNSYLHDAASLSSCPPIQNDIYDVVGTDLCNNGFTGFAYLWIWIIVSMLLLLIATIIMTVLNIYCGRYWDMNRNNNLNDGVFCYDDDVTQFNNAGAASYPHAPHVQATVIEVPAASLMSAEQQHEVNFMHEKYIERI